MTDFEGATNRTIRRDCSDGPYPGDVAAGQWIPRTGLGWEDEHFIIYFATTISLSLASRRPRVVAIALTMFAGVLEACQGLLPIAFLTSLLR